MTIPYRWIDAALIVAAVLLIVPLAMVLTAHVLDAFRGVYP